MQLCMVSHVSGVIFWTCLPNAINVQSWAVCSASTAELCRKAPSGEPRGRWFLCPAASPECDPCSSAPTTAAGLQSVPWDFKPLWALGIISALGTVGIVISVLGSVLGLYQHWELCWDCISVGNCWDCISIGNCVRIVLYQHWELCYPNTNSLCVLCPLLASCCLPRLVILAPLCFCLGPSSPWVCGGAVTAVLAQKQKCWAEQLHLYNCAFPNLNTFWFFSPDPLCFQSFRCNPSKKH